MRNRIRLNPGITIRSAVVETMERRTLLSSSITLDPTFGSGGIVTQQQTVAQGYFNLTAVNPVNGNVFVVVTENDNQGAASDYEMEEFSSSGAVVSAFGNNGLVVAGSQVPLYTGVAAAAVQSDGKLLVLDQGLYLTRYTTSGAVDTTFGTDGSVQYPMEYAGSLYLLPDGNIAVPGQVMQGDNAVSAIAVYNSRGVLDTSFGNEGVAIGVSGVFYGMTVDSSGDLIGLGSTAPAANSPAGTSSAGLVEQFAPSGKLDTAFGDGGAIVAANASAFLTGHVNPSGLSVTGYLQLASGPNFTSTIQINQYTLSGQPNKSFGSGNGYLSPTLEASDNYLSQYQYQPDGKLLLSLSQGNRQVLARLNANGSLDSAFGQAGYADVDYGGVNSIALEPDGKIVVACGFNGGPQFAPLRLLSDGSPDTSFGFDGFAGDTPLYTSADAVAQLPDGQMLVADEVVIDGVNGVVIRRYNANGSVDPTFAPGQGIDGQNGSIFIEAAGNSDASCSLSVDTQGNIFLGESGVGITRFSPQGKLDTAFGNNGLAALVEMGSFLLEANGQILVANGSDTITRLTATGRTDTSFGNSGTVTLPTTFSQSPGVLAVQPDGKILVGGTTTLIDDVGPVLTVLRLNSNGSVDTTFGSDGSAFADQLPTENQSGLRQTYSSSPAALAVLATGIIVLAGSDGQPEQPGDEFSGPTIAEFLPSGALNPNFGTGGQTNTYSPQVGVNTTVNNLIVQRDGTLVVVGTQSVGGFVPTGSSFFLLRYDADGSADSFFTNEIDQTNPRQITDDNQELDAVAGLNGTVVASGYFLITQGSAPFVARYLTEATGSVSGTVYNDYAGIPANFKTPVAGQIIYADLNDSGRFESGDPSAVTNAKGQYTLGGLPAGNVILRDELPGNQRQSYPAGGSGEHVTVGAAPITGVNFSVTTDTYVSGTVTKPAGAGAVRVYADLNHNGKLDSGEPVVTASSNGSFDFETLAAGTYTFRVIPPAGYVQAGPADDSGITVTLGSGGVDTQLSFVIGLPVQKLTGTVIGTAGSYNNQGNTIARAFDGNLSTFFDAPQASGAWAGLDLGSAQVVTQVQYAPRIGFDSRMVGGEIQASNSSNFSSGVVTLYTITSAPQAGVLTTQLLSNATAYLSYRYIGPTDGYCNIAELEFLG